MKVQDKEQVTQFISDSFNNYQITRELRLAEEDLPYLQRLYPTAKIEQMTNSPLLRKNWYKININLLQKNKPI